ncbi:sensor histidine kinase [Glaciibacter superstes]|uniref:sensor histidine kinase n=1 Tax=Glaciibacter superstes TaxID=501023 RepID=UPI0003B68417|nr:ATP-binding protein [Glaciibacter superstes]
MHRISKERDRLLRRTARQAGLAGAAVAILVALVALVPGVLPVGTLVGSIALLLAQTVFLYLIGRNGSAALPVLVAACGTAIVLLVGLAPTTDQELNVVGASVIGVVIGGAVAPVALVLLTTIPRLAMLGVIVVVTVGSVAVVTVSSGIAANALILTVVGWAAAILGGWWIGQSVPRVMDRIAAIGRAHHAERHASELEARRRQDARLLHDTVLATLTLLAHSGVGVNPDALRQQAGDDARLLRQLRLGGMPTPRTSGVFTLQPASDSSLGTTLESVKQRFGRMGLEVDWHGSGQVLLPSDVLDSFLLALAECLENVRRHSGVNRADVTITDDETTIRAMVTDAGVGFDLGGISSERLGFAESVVARLRDVGGNARLFSSPGSGTTVVLEVPK